MLIGTAQETENRQRGSGDVRVGAARARAGLAGKVVLAGMAASLAIAATMMGGSASAAPASVTSAASTNTFVGVGDWDDDGNDDVIYRTSTGYLKVYPGTHVAGYGTAPIYQIGNGWGGVTFVGVGDWDNDGNDDVVYRTSTGDLKVYPGSHVRGYSTRAIFKIGNGWGGVSFAGVGDWDDDGNDDVVFRTLVGDLKVYPGTHVRGYGTRPIFKIGNGWGGLTFAGVNDWDADGNDDVVFRTSTGLLKVYPGSHVRGYSSAPIYQIGNGWGDVTFAGVGDWDRDGNDDVVFRTSVGDLKVYAGSHVRGYSSRPIFRIGNGW